MSEEVLTGQVQVFNDHQQELASVIAQEISKVMDRHFDDIPATDDIQQISDHMAAPMTAASMALATAVMTYTVSSGMQEDPRQLMDVVLRTVMGNFEMLLTEPLSGGETVN